MLPIEDTLFTRIAIDVTLFGGWVTLLMAVEKLNQKKRTPHDYRFSVMFFFTAIFLLQTGLYLSGFAQRHPWACLFYFTVIFLVGPVNYWHNASYVQPNFSFNRLHLLSGVLGFLFDVAFQFRGPAYAHNFVDITLGEQGFTLAKVPFLLAGTHVLSYCVYGLARTIRDIGEDRDLLTHTYFLPLVQFVALCSILSLFVGMVQCNRALIAGGTAFISLNMILVMICYSQVKEVYQAASTEIKASKYKRSLLNGMDTKLIRKRLEALMTEEKIYEDFELNVKTVADRLSLSPQQLSQLLNEELGINFRNYVNRYRIDEAKRQLVQQKHKNILSICFDVGFSSKSVFYAAFKKETGITPSKFRDDVGQGVFDPEKEA